MGTSLRAVVHLESIVGTFHALVTTQICRLSVSLHLCFGVVFVQWMNQVSAKYLAKVKISTIISCHFILPSPSIVDEAYSFLTFRKCDNYTLHMCYTYYFCRKGDQFVRLYSIHPGVGVSIISFVSFYFTYVIHCVFSFVLLYAVVAEC